ncbi:phage gp6-like head-tail connector protein [Peribacillus sp. TH16]|uniref:phage gp6-like head-tail connector protein n=1 Tax=Peribacillus sp. TH16 TaxID=2798482 RepID=UPI001914166D|nr:phage gp6-like head-tail connector protein [Peribacillus sp. TH16]MBK5481050.1 phage gp6-like head-tail connector protein [Peribacillus sp. TH16]
MHISHSSEDDNLKRLLSFSLADLQEKCGKFDIDENERAKELVFERTRYAYNDALEYFNDNFLNQINSLGLSIAFKEGESDAAV